MLSNIFCVIILLIICECGGTGAEGDCVSRPVCCRREIHEDNCTCDSFIDALDHLNSNTFINVTATNVELSSIILLNNLEFIAIIGHNDPIVTCTNGGGIHFSSCHNCTIEGITWVGCGTASKQAQPAFLFYNSSNITIQGCTFQHSTGQALVLSEISYHVSINHCKFVNSTHYGGHGAAIHFSSRTTENFKAALVTIDNCIFSHNTAGSFVYVGQSGLQGFVLMKESSFYSNNGNPIVLSKQTLHIHGAVVLEKNTANKGGGIFATDNSNVIFDKNANVMFLRNEAGDGGAMYLSNHSRVLFNYNSIVTFTDNKAKNGGAVSIEDNSRIIFDATSDTKFVNNKATNNYGGAIKSLDSSIVLFRSFATLLFNGNKAKFGGAIFSDDASAIVFEGSTTVQFDDNDAKENGGALLSHDNSTILFTGNTVVTFTNNLAVNSGAAVRSNKNCKITFAENSIVKFANNSAFSGGAISSQNYADLIFEGNSSVTLDTNKANDGGSLYMHTFSKVMFKGNGTTIFYNNTAGGSGGAVYFYGHSNITVTESPNLNFTRNVAKTGGAIYGAICDVSFSGNSKLAFKNNEAVHEGGAIYVSDQSNIVFDKNIYMTLTSNGATYGAGMYSNLSGSSITLDSKQFHHYNNTAVAAGSLMYVHIPSSCNRSCLDKRIVGSTIANLITTPPKLLVLNEPAIPTCSNYNTEECSTYYINNIMLGQEISINACLMDYYDQPAEEVVDFLVSSENKKVAPSSNYIIVSRCSDVKFIITGNRTVSMNYSMTLSTLRLHVEERKKLSVNLIVGLTSCHPGFHHNGESHKCECYGTAKNIVICSGSSSMIHRGYWFGELDGKATVASCPVSYCDFNSCNTASEFCDLSPARTDQCRSHRSGTACGNCENGYTLPFYSTECINENNCTVSQTVIVIVLTVVYWIALVIAIFITMYYKVSIGYLYAITYYYSMVDVLLSEYLYIPNGLYITINIMYSIVKLTPQFLGKLCLVRGLSGIDQQFIHYVHPLAVSLMLVMIVVLARFSRRLSVFISRGIIRVICFLLLLSYTSVTVTSLHLVKYLKFSDVDKIYTYLSPDIEYFQGRHLAYGIIALLCIIFIVIGVPLILIAEPFLNHKISFIKMKPLLDQFQGCYKDKYRWFSGYYMICRIVIITITIIFSSSDFTSRYLLITTCAAILLIHLSVRPYKSKLLNAFDGLLLLLLVLVSILFLAEFINLDSVVPISFALLILPLTVFSVLCAFIHKEVIKKTFHLKFVASKNNVDRKDVDNNSPKRLASTGTADYDLTIDDSMRKNATICDV